MPDRHRGPALQMLDAPDVGRHDHLRVQRRETRLAFHPPCTLQHGIRARRSAAQVANLAPLEAHAIVSANIGCIQHLQSGTTLPVRHWVEVVDEALG